MTRTPRIPGKEVVRALEKADFIIKRQSDSHVIMRHETDLERRCVIPVHGSTIVKPGTLQSILRGAGLSTEDFRKLL